MPSIQFDSSNATQSRATFFAGGRAVPSQSDVQQGDPLGPSLFALALQPALQRLNAARFPGGLQQASLTWTTSALLATSGLSRTPLQLNGAKCEVISCAGFHSHLQRNLFSGTFAVKDEANFELLGTPVGSDDFCNTHTQERVDKATIVLAALGELPGAQVALLLLRVCACFGRLVYSLCSVPPDAHRAALQNFDAAVLACFGSFTCLSVGSREWSLASISTARCRLSLRATERHSAADFLASRIACSELCRKLDPEDVWERTNTVSALCPCLDAYKSKVLPEARPPRPLKRPRKADGPLSSP